MTKNHFLIFKAIGTFCLATIAIIILIADQNEWTDSKNTVRGIPLTHHVNPTSIRKFTITCNEFSFSVVRDSQNKWVIQELQNFPADPLKVSNFLTQIQKTHLAQEIFQFSDQVAPFYYLKDPQKAYDGSGFKIQFWEQQEKPVDEIIIGDMITTDTVLAGRVVQQENRGRFCLNSDQIAGAIAIPFSSELNDGHTAWIAHAQFSFEHIRNMKLMDAKNQLLWSFSRTSITAPFRPTDQLEKEVDFSKLRDFAAILSKVDYLSVVPKALAEKPTHILQLHTADDLLYTIWIAKGDPKTISYFWYDIQESNTKLTPDSAFLSNGTEITLPRERPLLDRKIQNDRYFSQWAYVLPTKAISLLAPDRKDFLKIKPTKTPNKIR